jgi:hypothetical protein
MATRIPPDGCLVPTEPFSELVRTFVSRWNRDRPQLAGQFAAGGTIAELTPIRPLAWLAAASGLSESTIENVADGRYRMTELRVADAIATALDYPDILQGLAVVPNPSASRAARAECCGGSSSAAAA